MGRKIRKIAVSELADIEINIIMDKYTELITANETKSAPYRAVLRHKLIFLIHLIITRCKASKDNIIQLNSDRLQDVLGNEYDYMLATLQNMGIITIGESYLVGEYCRSISLNDWNIKEEILPNEKVIEYLKKWEKLRLKAKKDIANDFDTKIDFVDGKPQIRLIPKGENILSREEMDFRTKYEESLSYLRLKVGKSEAQEFINTLFTNFDNHSYHYYSNMVQTFDENNLKIYSIDAQN